MPRHFHGFEDKEVLVSFPLSRNRMLLMGWQGVEGIGSVGRECVEDLNCILARGADQYLFAHADHKSVTRLAHRYRKSRIRMRGGGFGPERNAEVRIGRLRKRW
jgi:hypothetical protein